MIFPRWAADEVAELLETFRVVVIGGARQVGKSTLAVTHLGLDGRTIFSLDDPAFLEQAREDPLGFVEALPVGAVVDEFQRAGQPFLLAVKRLVDRDPAKGRIVLTGSANYLAARSVTETLAGRAGRLELWPLSVGERLGRRETFFDTAFDTAAPPVSAEGGRMSRDEIVSLILEGGYPEVVRDRLTPARRTRWFDAYVEDVVNREALRPLADVRHEHDLRRVLGALAARVGSELVISDLARDLGLDRGTVTSYVALLEALYLVHLLPAFSTSAVTATKRRPTVHLNDTGLAANLTGLGERDLSALTAHRLAGPLLEQFVVVELMKQRSWSRRPVVDLRHYRDREGREVDVILEDRRSGEIVAIEVKSTSTPTHADARHLRYLRDRLGVRFVAGIVLHLGAQTLPLDDRIRCQPVSTLWESGAEPHW